LVIHWSVGDEEFIVTKATLSALAIDGSVRLIFDAHTDGKRARPAGDALKCEARPSAEVIVSLPTVNPENLVGQRFEVRGYDEVTEEQEATLFYLEHDLLMNNVIDILAREGKAFHVRWTGLQLAWGADESEAGPPIEIVAWFTFAEMEKWLSPSR
jgi:hypothetical protein